MKLPYQHVLMISNLGQSSTNNYKWKIMHNPIKKYKKM